MDLREYGVMFRAESRHWWFRGSRRVVQELLERYRPVGRGRAPLRVVDLGCGTGYTLSRLERVRGIEACGLDLSKAALGFCRRRGLDGLAVGRVEELPLASRSTEVLLALDVLEHIADDGAAVREMARVVHDEGIVIITVPAHNWLWSEHDEALRHKRRYQRRSLDHLLREAGFEVLFLSYYNTFLLPAIAAVRLWRRMWPQRERKPTSDVSVPSAVLNSLLGSLLGAERHVLARSRLPLGVSLLAVARVGGL